MWTGYSTTPFSELGLEEERTEGRGVTLLRQGRKMGEPSALLKETRHEQRSALLSNVSHAEGLLRKKQGNVKGWAKIEPENGHLRKVWRWREKLVVDELEPVAVRKQEGKIRGLRKRFGEQWSEGTGCKSRQNWKGGGLWNNERRNERF